MKLALGTVQFGIDYGIANKNGQVKTAEVISILEYANSRAIDTLDTAIAYGESEQLLGKIGINKWKVITKLPDIPKDCSDITGWVKQNVENSLSRLNVPNLHGLLLHNPAQLMEARGEELYKALNALKCSNVVNNIGISIYSPNELDDIIKAYEFDLVQGPFNVFDRRMHSSGWLIKLKKCNIKFHARSVFLQGLLLMSREDRPEKFHYWDKLLSKWDDWLLTNQITAAQACLNFVMSYLEVDKVIVGVDSLSQLKNLVNVLSEPVVDIPQIFQCDDVNLINPGYWSKL